MSGMFALCMYHFLSILFVLFKSSCLLLQMENCAEMKQGCAFRITGVNVHYGTPVNPSTPRHIPGGSSSGSAVAVAGQLVDFALGMVVILVILTLKNNTMFFER